MEYRHVIGWRRVFLALQFLALVALISVYFLRPERAPKATRYLAADQVLTTADLVADSSEDLLGKAVKAPVSRGERVTPDMVKIAPPPLAASSATLAAVISIAESTAVQRRLDPGAKVLIRRQNLQDIVATVVSRTCRQQTCVVAVTLEQLPAAEKLDLHSFAAADLVPAPASKP